MNSDFINRSNYLVAFLAALIGLAAFQNYFSNHHITIFAHSYTWLSLCVPLLCTIIFAVYISALSYFVSSVTFTKLPVSRYLINVANFSAIIGLIYPLALLLVILTSYLFHQFHWVSHYINAISHIATSSTAVISAFAALYIAKNFGALRIDSERQKILDSFERSLRKDVGAPAGKDRRLFFLYEYEYLHKLLVRSVQFLGYGVNRKTDVADLTRILKQKQLLTQIDVQVAEELTKLRDTYSHGDKNIKKSELDNALGDINNLQRRIKVAIIDRNV